MARSSGSDYCAVCLNDLRATRAALLRQAREYRAAGAAEVVAALVRAAFEAHDRLLFWKRVWGM